MSHHHGWDDHGMLGIAAALGEVLHQQRYDSWVHAFMAQGMNVEQARAAANEALGIRPPNYVVRAVGWTVAALISLALATPDLPGSLGLLGPVAAFCLLMRFVNRRRALSAGQMRQPARRTGQRPVGPRTEQSPDAMVTLEENLGYRPRRHRQDCPCRACT